MDGKQLMDALKMMNAQNQRNQASRVLYLGNLQDNNDTYYKANNLNSLLSVPEPPPALYREIGATTEVDKRMFFIPQPITPTSAAQEALNQYFANQRVQDFARGQQRLAVGDILAKQAEQNAERLIKDELDRRVNIRTAVLNATGMTPAQVQEELVREGLAGAMQSQSVFDARDQQVRDAVGRYYNTMGGEVMPATLPTTNPIAATTPSIIAPAGAATVPMPAGVAAAALPKPTAAGGDFGAGTGAVPEEEELEEQADLDDGGPPPLEPDLPLGEFDPTSNAAMGAGAGANRARLAEAIVAQQIRYTGLASDGTERSTIRADGSMKTVGTLMTYGLTFLQSALASDAETTRANDSTVGSGQ